MEDHKLLYLQNFLRNNKNYRLEDYIQRVKSWENDARNCYDKQIKLNSDQFVEMMLLDGIFVIQFFLMAYHYDSRLPNDRIFNEPWMLNDVFRDMALLENQIPFFVIQRLLEMAFETQQQLMLVWPKLVWHSFSMIMSKELPGSVMELEVKHFVHLISLLFMPSRRDPPNGNEEMKFTPSAKELVAAGVKLRRCKS